VADMLRLVVWEMKSLPPQVARFLPSAEVAKAYRLPDETQEAERCCLEVAAANDAGGWQGGYGDVAAACGDPGAAGRADGCLLSWQRRG
jgi:hypothetical protein